LEIQLALGALPKHSRILYCSHCKDKSIFKCISVEGFNEYLGRKSFVKYTLVCTRCGKYASCIIDNTLKSIDIDTDS